MTDQVAGEEVPTFELGDRVMIVGGNLDQTRGRIYYMDSDLIRILADGVSDRLIDLPLEEGDFSPELGIDTIYLLTKAANPAFVAQIDAQVGQLADTFGPGGEVGIQYTIAEINEAEDTMTLTDTTDATKHLIFRSEFHRGIEQSEPFIVLRPKYRPEEGMEREEGVAAENEGGEGVAAENEGEFQFENVDTFEEEDVFIGLTERPETMRVYPDSVQRDEMIRSLLELLDVKLQRLPNRQREVRQVTEQLILLRNEIVKYSIAGDPVGQYPTSFQTVGELIEKGDIPLARPVMDVRRNLYVTPGTEENINTDQYKLNVGTMYETVKDETTLLNTQINAAATQLTADSLPNWFVAWELFFRTYMRPFTSGVSQGDTVTFRGDKEFLRAPAPREGEEDVDGLLMDGKEGAQRVGKVSFSLMKGLGPRMTRVKMKEAPRRVESGDEAVVTSQLIFPLSTERDLGSTRSGSLARDIHNSHEPSKGLQDTLRELGGVPEEATTGGILSIGIGGNTTGNIAIEDWLKAQPLHIRGLGDALIQTKSLGLTQRELTADQQEALFDKIKSFRAILKQHITDGIEASKGAIAGLRLENETFLQGEALEELLAVLSTEPMLADRMNDLRRILPAYKDCDVALVAGISAQMADLFLTAMSGQPGPLAKERNRRVRDKFLEALRNSMTKVYNKEHSGEVPTPNKCPHVNDLATMRLIHDDSERMAALGLIVTNYQKGRQGNWIMCNNCPQPLICYHEKILLEEFKHPREKEVLHKELLLKFSGGQFHGKYMCKNCGQGISNMDFDRGMEFTEGGVPMSNSAEMEDTREAEEKAVEALIGVEGEEGQGQGEEEYKTDTQKLIYKTAAKIYERLGLVPDKAAYKGLIQRVEAEILKQPSREEYARQQKALAAKGAGAGKALDYDTRLNRILVIAVGTHMIIEIQTHTPDYVPRYRIPGCVVGFTGYPLGPETDKTIVNYVSCAIAGIREHTAPWSLTGFTLEQNDKRRQDMIAANILKFIEAAMKMAIVQQLITQKRIYYENLYGSVTGGGGIFEDVPPGFKPIPYAVKPDEAAEAVIIPEAAGPQELVRAWIQTGHRLARQNGTYIRGSPFSETTCCYTPLEEPRGFWSEKGGLPVLPTKQAPIGQHDTYVMFPFTPRRLAKLLADPPDDLFYRVFLRVCYDGPRKGLLHEPGYTNQCAHCGFTFPESPYIETPAPPLSSDNSRNKEMLNDWKAEMEAIITRGKGALESQRVVVTKDTFEDILDASHLAYRVSIPVRKEPVVGMKLLEKLRGVVPEPFDGWRILLTETMERVAKLPAEADELSVAEAYGPMSNTLVEVLSDIERRVGAPHRKALESLFERSPAQISEVVRTYILVTFQRLLTGFKHQALKVMKRYELPTETREDVEKEIKERLGFLDGMSKHVKGYTQVKLETARDALAAVIPILKHEVRANLVPGGALAIPYLVGCLLAGIIGEFINPNVIQEGARGGRTTVGGGVDATARVPLNILDMCLARMRTEGLSYTEDQIRELLVKRAEAEKLSILRRMDNMSPEEKRVELMNQRLGLGAYAVGGTKAIYRLDKDQYVRERMQRADMGIAGEFGGTADVQAAMDQYTYNENFGGGGEGAEGGYDNEQMAADDY